MNRLVGIALSALLLILSYPPFDMGWLAWGALVPWLVTLEAASARQAFLRSYMIGLLFFGGTMWWVAYVTVPGILLLVAALALYFGIWGWVANRWLAGPHRWRLLLTLPASWVLLEYLRTILLTGLGWNLLAHSQWHWIPLIQIADLTGVTGVSFLIVLVNVAFWLAYRGPRPTERSSLSVRGFPLLCALFCLLMTLAYGFSSSFRCARGSLSPEWSFKVALVQGNIPQFQKWDKNFEEMIWKRYETLTHEAAKGAPDLILWPETSVPGFLEEPNVMNRLREIAHNAKTHLLLGTPAGSPGESEPFRHLFNSAVLLDSRGKIVDRYDKIHLVPFGEYLPLESVLGWLRNFVVMGEFSFGERWTIFRPSTAENFIPPWGVLICFEDLFPGLCRHVVQEGAQWFVVITNDAWFIRSAASLQHLQASVFRAVEHHLWVVRAANTGWSGFIDPTGHLLPDLYQVPRFEAGFAIAPVGISPVHSFYTRWGDWFPLLCLLLLVGLTFFPSQKPV